MTKGRPKILKKETKPKYKLCVLSEFMGSGKGMDVANGAREAIYNQGQVLVSEIKADGQEMFIVKV